MSSMFIITYYGSKYILKLVMSKHSYRTTSDPHFCFFLFLLLPPRSPTLTLSPMIPPNGPVKETILPSSLLAWVELSHPVLPVVALKRAQSFPNSCWPRWDCALSCTSWSVSVSTSKPYTHFTLMTEAARCSDTLVSYCITTQHHNPEDQNLCHCGQHPFILDSWCCVSCSCSFN